ncbi:ATPase family protein associated with various cellular activities (AAA) [Bernardetia litoralis DSM 6794]|uniref:ATPase family protein associated with various cellular activities (AAA) n=1 Tax=Bernardetia litoralis (strain ATCC 23117 / DSM 6794 / NBRC 15988 / NCIMB 1366 / Fx l1 / Sio-4) TaxID=880071 RepID=I4ANG0_BERLS|nr:AAA family ATPase [Bernardetia litoralis]AFM05495.1 ATPase family protein associated with various cellular activities (AAA) [Bernardetia litoralis DSM 6794]
MHNTNRNSNSNDRRVKNMSEGNNQLQKGKMNQETNPYLGKYNVFGDGYFSEDYYLLNRHNQKLIDFNVRDYFESNQLVSLNQFLKIIEENNYNSVSMYRRNTTYNKKESRYSIDWYLLLDDESIIINITYDAVQKLDDVIFRFDMITAIENTPIEKLEKLFELATKCIIETKESDKRYINIVGNTPRIGLTLRKHQIKPPAIPDLDLYYGDKFEEKHDVLVTEINKKNNSGLFIFHGVTGSGKTNYIRYLISKAKPEIEFIFYPITLLREITSPDLITFLSDYQDAVLIIEESEDSVQARDLFNTDKSSIANLLNVSDGLLSDVLNLKIICTFNTDIKNLDKALLREGRLSGIHRFEALPIENANKIAKLNNIEREFKEPATLAQIYNVPLNEDFSDFSVRQKKIGFGK